jgi:hypothetical protein
MKRNLFLFVILLITKGIGAQTMTTHTMNDVKIQVEKALENTNSGDILVAFDIDMTLIQSDHPATSYPTLKKHGTLYKKIFGSLPSEVKDVTLNLPAQFPSKLVEEATPQMIENLQAKGIKIIALTAALTGYLPEVFGKARIEELRHSALDELGINFENTFDFKEVTFKTIPPYRNNHPSFFKGLLFSNGEQGDHNKGTVLTIFLKHANFTPKVVIFVDDRKKNIEQVKQALKESYPETQFIGIEYLGAFNSPPQDISESDFHAFWQGLVERAKSLQ